MKADEVKEGKAIKEIRVLYMLMWNCQKHNQLIQ